MLTGVELSPWLAALSAAGRVTAADLLIDPLATGGLHYWHWPDRGSCYGVPLQNFLGWFVVSWLIFRLRMKTDSYSAATLTSRTGPSSPEGSSGESAR